ncbi:UNVERIFIED_CONTAM: hypothetical protein FKN15_022013, partial [Acipenser sinensis]
DMWNCYDAVEQHLPHTNSSVEGWHRAFGELLGSRHPSIWTFMEDIQKEQALNELKMEQLIAGNLPPEGRVRYHTIARNIELIVADYFNRPLCDYLLSIAHNIEFQFPISQTIRQNEPPLK